MPDFRMLSQWFYKCLINGLHLRTTFSKKASSAFKLCRIRSLLVMGYRLCRLCVEETSHALGLTRFCLDSCLKIFFLACLTVKESIQWSVSWTDFVFPLFSFVKLCNCVYTCICVYSCMHFGICLISIFSSCVWCRMNSLWPWSEMLHSGGEAQDKSGGLKIMDMGWYQRWRANVYEKNVTW